MAPKVFYNDECSICNFEINHYKKKCNIIEWHGIHNSELTSKIKKKPSELIRRLHVQKNNELLVGVDAFIFIWSNIPKYKFLSVLINTPVIYQLSLIAYEIIAFFLFIKNLQHVKKLNKKFNIDE